MSNSKHQEPEIPEIIIERDDDLTIPTQDTSLAQKPVSRPWLLWSIGCLVLLLLVVAALWGYNRYNNYMTGGLPISVTPQENISHLQQPLRAKRSAVLHTTDSVQGVAMDFYALQGLRGAIEWQEPDTTDAAVYLYARSSDYTASGQYLGSLVVQGQEHSDDVSRLGYVAMADSNIVIGVGRSEAVKDYVQERGGSFFRQFVLVSNGVLPTRFYLHGKVERRAIGRKDNTLYYVATRHPETLWGFADALREYGFADVVYLTGGNHYCYYRSADGARHDIGDPALYPNRSHSNVLQPWLVFRAIRPVERSATSLRKDSLDLH